MTIDHSPEMDPREPREGDMETFHGLEVGDEVTFFEWPVSSLEVVGWEEDGDFGEYVRVESEGDVSYLYVVNGHIWHYTPDVEDESNPFAVQSLRVKTNA